MKDFEQPKWVANSPPKTEKTPRKARQKTESQGGLIGGNKGPSGEAKAQGGWPKKTREDERDHAFELNTPKEATNSGVVAGVGIGKGGEVQRRKKPIYRQQYIKPAWEREKRNLLHHDFNNG